MEKYQIGRKISEGAFGIVYEAKDADNKIYAVKQLYRSSQNVSRQLTILKQLASHPNIIAIHLIIQDKLTSSIVMERGSFDLGDWMSAIQYPIDEDYVRVVAKCILKGLEHIHSHGYIHRDLKPTNILVNNEGNKLMICDFGSAVKYDGKTEYEIEGFTRWYKCPEMIFGDRKYSYEVDIWSLGCILMEVASGEPFFNGKSELEQLSLMSQCIGSPTIQNWSSVKKMPDHGKINFKIKHPLTIQQLSKQRSISKELCEFIRLMVSYQNRPTAQQLLNHSYLANHKFNKTIFELGHLKCK